MPRVKQPARKTSVVKAVVSRLRRALGVEAEASAAPAPTAPAPREAERTRPPREGGEQRPQRPQGERRERPREERSERPERRERPEGGERLPRPERSARPDQENPRPPREEGEAGSSKRRRRRRRKDRSDRPEQPATAETYEGLPSAAVAEPTETVEVPFLFDTPSPWDDLGLANPVLRAVREAGYERPTPIQAEAIPLLLAGRDVIGGSQTGTGKTAAFMLPILSRLGRHQPQPRVLVLEPTRELAQQVIAQVEKYGKYAGLRAALLHGGVGYGRQRQQLEQGVDIIVATPGRLLDFLGQKAVSLKGVQTLVLDEADRMLDMGFLPDVTKILDRCPKERQSLLFSATIPPEIEHLSQRMLKDPAQVKIGGGRQPAQTISHAIYLVDERQKFDLLTALLQHLDYHSVLVFTRTKARADTIARWLENAGHQKVGILHSDRTQRERDQTLAAFKAEQVEVLVATDIIARGIDISGISHVINYDIPENPEDYVHRIGRTGRAERSGDAVTIVTATDLDFLKAIERFIGRDIERRKLEGFNYQWSPVFEAEKQPKAKKRNRGFQSGASYRWNKR